MHQTSSSGAYVMGDEWFNPGTRAEFRGACSLPGDTVQNSGLCRTRHRRCCALSAGGESVSTWRACLGQRRRGAEAATAQGTVIITGVQAACAGVSRKCMPSPCAASMIR